MARRSWRWLLPGLTAWVVVPTARAQCRPAVWQGEARVGLREVEHGGCLEVDDALSAEANHARFVGFCGHMRRCGRTFARVRTAAASFWVPSRQVLVLAEPYPDALPVAPTIGPLCVAGKTRPEGVDFTPFEVGRTRRLPGHVRVAVCRQVAGRLLAWWDGRPGWLASDAVALGDGRIPEAGFAPGGQLCQRPLWPARALRETRLFVPGSGPVDEHVMIAPEAELTLLEVDFGAGRWLLASAGSTVGWVWAADLALMPGLLWSDPEPTTGACPEAETAALVRPARVRHWVLPQGATVWRWRRDRPREARHVEARWAGVDVSGGVSLGPWRPVQRAWRASQWLDHQTWSAADPALSRFPLPTGLPPWLVEVEPPTPVPSPSSAAEPTELTRRIVGALAVDQQPAVSPRRVVAVGPVDEPAWQVGHALAEGRVADALLGLVTTDAQPVSNVTHAHLWAEALLQLGCPALAAEWWLALIDRLLPALPQAPVWSPNLLQKSMEIRWLRVAVAGYREAARRWQPHPRAAVALWPLCERGATEACFLGLHAAVADHASDTVRRFAAQLTALPLDARERALLASVVAQGDDGAQPAAWLLAQATAQACRQCPRRSELVQTLLLQTARAARDAGDADAAEEAGTALMPDVWAAHPDLAARRLPPDDARTARWLQHLRRTGHEVEAELWRSALDTEAGRLPQAAAALHRAGQQLHAAVQLWARLQRRPRVGSLAATLRGIDLALRQVGVVSRDVPELAHLLAPAGACGRWLELAQERQRLTHALAEVDAQLPRWLTARAAGSQQQLETDCRRQLDAVPQQLVGRLRELKIQREAAGIDLDEAQVQAIEMQLRQLDAP